MRQVVGLFREHPSDNGYYFINSVVSNDLKVVNYFLERKAFTNTHDVLEDTGLRNLLKRNDEVFLRFIYCKLQYTELVSNQTGLIISKQKQRCRERMRKYK